ncbi:hypothetical protein QQ045_015812 [Rhodiola kirilowii]
MTHDVQTQLQQHHYSYSTAAGYGGEIDSIRRRFRGIDNQQSTSFSPPFNNNFQSDKVFGIYHHPADEMAEDFRPEHDPTSSSMDRVADESWLGLRLGAEPRQSSTQYRSTRLVELDLMPGRSTEQTNSQQQYQVIRSNTVPPAFFHAPDQFRVPPPRPIAWLQSPLPEIDWTLMRRDDIITRPQQLGSSYYVANPSTSLIPMGPNFFARPYGRQMGLDGGGGVSSSSTAGGGMRIIRPPRRPNAGVWFMLQASQNQVRQPYLPQIPKSYLRIKDGRMTVKLLMKYLVHKLGLESESEVELRCRGQELQPILTLQHVRDNIWCSRRDAPPTLLADSASSSTTLPSAVAADTHIMILHYARPISTTAAAATTTATSSAAAPFF